MSSDAQHIITLLFFSHVTSTTEISTLSLHDALPISQQDAGEPHRLVGRAGDDEGGARAPAPDDLERQVRVLERDRKSTRLNSSHITISYAVFCLKKKKRRDKNRCIFGRAGYVRSNEQ